MKTWIKNARVVLENNPHVESVGDKQIVYTKKFKEDAIKAYAKGKSPTEIFSDALLNPKVFPKSYCSKSIIRWSQASVKYGKKSLTEERRGRSSTGRPKGLKKSNQTLNQKQMEARLAYLEAENDFLKKLHALAKQGK